MNSSECAQVAEVSGHFFFEAVGRRKYIHIACCSRVSKRYLVLTQNTKLHYRLSLAWLAQTLFSLALCMAVW